MSPVNQAFSAFAFLGFVVSLIPLRWHLEAWNTGTVLYMFWSAIGCLVQFIDSIIYNDNAKVHSVIWCDISTHIKIAYGVAIPCCSLIINRRLFEISSVRTVTVMPSDRRRAMMIDLLIGLGGPLLEMVLYIVPQGHRADVYENIGCMPTVYMTPVAFAVVYIWPIVIGLISAVYCGLILYQFGKRRAQFNELLKNNPNLNVSRYWRLMALATTDIFFTIPFGVYYMVVNSKSMSPWISWEDTHSGFNRVDQYPEFIWSSDTALGRSIEFERWIYVISAAVFFAFFGFAAEALRNYRSAYESLKSKSGFGSSSSSNSKGFITSFSKSNQAARSSPGSLPVFIKQSKSVTTDGSFGALSIPDLESIDVKEKAELPSPSSSDASYSTSSRPTTPTEAPVRPPVCREPMGFMA